MIRMLPGFWGQAYKDEDAIIEEILPLALTVIVFGGSDTEVVLPGRLWSALWICKQSDWFDHNWSGKLAQRRFVYRKE